MKGFDKEPVAVVHLIKAVVYLLTVFGVIQWTDIQAEAVFALAAVSTTGYWCSTSAQVCRILAMIDTA